MENFSGHETVLVIQAITDHDKSDIILRLSNLSSELVVYLRQNIALKDNADLSVATTNINARNTVASEFSGEYELFMDGYFIIHNLSHNIAQYLKDNASISSKIISDLQIREQDSDAQPKLYTMIILDSELRTKHAFQIPSLLICAIVHNVEMGDNYGYTFGFNPLNYKNEPYYVYSGTNVVSVYIKGLAECLMTFKGVNSTIVKLIQKYIIDTDSRLQLIEGDAYSIIQEDLSSFTLYYDYGCISQISIPKNMVDHLSDNIVLYDDSTSYELDISGNQDNKKDYSGDHIVQIYYNAENVASIKNCNKEFANTIVKRLIISGIFAKAIHLDGSEKPTESQRRSSLVIEDNNYIYTIGGLTECEAVYLYNTVVLGNSKAKKSLINVMNTKLDDRDEAIMRKSAIIAAKPVCYGEGYDITVFAVFNYVSDDLSRRINTSKVRKK